MPGLFPLSLDLDCAVERLGNGLRAAVVRQRGVPIVTVDVTYDVGSRVEAPGKTGLAHLFEHLMFEGSENVPKGDHFRLVAEAGGVTNGTTSEDRTNYFETLPVESLDLALYLEADRMRGLALSEEALAAQREAVKEEKRLRIDNQPYAPSFEAVDALVYDAFAYRHPVIGSMEDLDAAALGDLREFHGRHYAPGNAFVCVVGDLGTEEALDAVRHHFGGLAARDLPPPFVEEEPEGSTNRRASVTDRHAALPALHLAFKAPPRRHPDNLALLYAEKVLSGGESGFLWRRLVKDGESALSFSAHLDERRGPSLFRTFAVARPGTALVDLEREVSAGLARLAAEGPTPAEHERARRMLAFDTVRATQTTQSLAFLLSEYGLYDGDPLLFREDVGRLLSMTPAEVREACARCFAPERRTVVEVLAEGRGEEE